MTDTMKTPHPTRRSRLVPLAAALLSATLMAAPARAQTDPATTASPAEITADSVDMDFEKRTALFRGNVQVNDRGMTLTSDLMLVQLSATNELKHVEASGNVVILQPQLNRKASSQKAVYDVAAGKIVLTGQPILQMGDNRMTNAAQITYFRDSQRVICEGTAGTDRPKIRFKPGT